MSRTIHEILRFSHWAFSDVATCRPCTMSPSEEGLMMSSSVIGNRTSLDRPGAAGLQPFAGRGDNDGHGTQRNILWTACNPTHFLVYWLQAHRFPMLTQIGRASCRERV